MGRAPAKPIIPGQIAGIRILPQRTLRTAEVAEGKPIALGGPPRLLGALRVNSDFPRRLVLQSRKSVWRINVV